MDSATEAALPGIQPRSWTRDVGRLDAGLVVAAAALGAWTVWVSSEPIASILNLGVVDIAWPIVGVVWSLSVARSATADAGRFIALLLAVAAGLTFAGIAPFVALVLFGPLPLLAGFAVCVAGFVALPTLERRPRSVWLIAPGIVLATIAVSLSGVPRALRFEAAKPAITTYAEGLIRDGAQPAPEGSSDDRTIRIGSYEVLWAIRRDGCAYLATTYVGILDEVEAGLAYCPTALPAGEEDRFVRLSDGWYQWAGGGFD